MPARDANRGRGGGRKGAGNKPNSAGGRQASAAASSTSSTRGGAAGSAGSRGGSAGGRSSSRTTGNAQPSRTVSGANAGSGRPGGGGASGGARGAASGDITSGGIATAGTAPSGAPRARDVNAALLGGGSTSDAQRTPERQRDIEPVRENQAARPASATTSGGAQAGTRVAGRPQAKQGLSAWLPGADNPLAMMRRMQEDLDSVFRAFGIPRFAAALAPPRELEELLARTPALTDAARWSPQIEVFERDGNLVVHADLPGVKRDDVEVSVDGDVLTIRGERRQENREAHSGYRRTERSYGTFFRQIPLPEGVDPTEIAATYEDGVLQVIIPSRDQERARRRVDIR